jgi:prepilin-type N-terminal cleavage/methylation domain-containing protein
MKKREQFEANRRISEYANKQSSEAVKQTFKAAAFTLAEGATHVENCNDCRKTAFTLAEVLITLGIIGVVAAIALPALITNINDRANSERQANIAQKITQAMEQMRAHGELVQYSSTDEFVNVLQKYLKITKRCDADHLAECWTTSNVSVMNSNVVSDYNVSTAKTRKKLLKNSTTDGNNVGLILADGASLILTYNPSAPIIDIGDKVLGSTMSLPIGKNKYKDFPYTTSVTGSIDFVMDVNGKKGPNKERYDNKMYDIRPFRLASFAEVTPCEKGTDGSGCIKLVESYSPVDCSEGNSSSADYQQYCGPHPSGYSDDNWAGAKKVCDEAGMTLPTRSVLHDTYYNNKANFPSIASTTGYFWASDEDPSNPQQNGRGVNFATGSMTNGNPKNLQRKVLCVGN